MARMFAFAMLAVGLILFFNSIGLPIGAQSVQDKLNLEDGTITDSTFWRSLFDENTGILILALAGGIAISFFARSPAENYIVLPFLLGPLVLLAGTFTSMITNFSGTVNGITYPIWGKTFLLTTFGMLLVGYCVSLVEWFRGNN